ncbi:hypothetical protein BCL52_1718 [Salisediminibacterium halotolerans]|uniref:Uncharacterized protein n=2 Tax=Salisediminibacterium halotolerans TaxID=517425 RepID=A0A1H9WAJ5_9BACI|nr:hypothetical protein BCL39_1721 [Actinophytocola xinjiangensis]RPE87476.1 hypothetical protein EDD67_1210 [Salisediminibacterium halotolerans]TWG35267.1 hypothetical protein BCL52_1718 [Salisediminibacterium halotolerans]GEL06748.1 hypothetical protein SHA02_01640 [Salisediminibacterium halotolerans]SES30834.1 hypothetical protein SAMN05444126_1311 [Salisediminibacterium haloalkalitolerans]
MGYIPPVTYDQNNVYAGREPSVMPLIQGPSAVERIQFHEALKNHEKPKAYLHASLKKKQQLMQAKLIENSLTDRGERFDKSV